MEKNRKISEWVNQFTDEMFRWAYQKTSSSETASDLVQDTFLAASEKFESFKGKSTAKTWLFAILNHKIIDHYRKKAKQSTVSDDQLLSAVFNENGSWNQSNTPYDWQEEKTNLLDDTNFLKVFQQCMEDLPENWYACVKLKYILNKTGTEICQELNIAQTNYWQIIHRAKLQLRGCLEKNWFAS
ncbi:MAG: sigma-70 family RNA polymerase sigma factor [Bacteroidota bacterium]